MAWPCLNCIRCIVGLAVAATWHLASSSGYIYTDPARFGSLWETESRMELERSSGECFCDESPHAALWKTFQADLTDNLAVDPSFEGAWVHGLCSFAHPVLFKLAIVNEMGGLEVRSDCAAGLMAMAVVCMQSVAIEAHSVAQWKWTERVVQDEGASVGDYEGRIPLAECLRRCEADLACSSIAHGPHGCHLKDRCVQPNDALQPEGVHAEGYHTFYRPCFNAASPVAAFAQVENLATAASQVDAGGRPSPSPGVQQTRPAREHPRIEEMFLYSSIIIQLLESAAHCLPASTWPFSVAEVVENYAEFQDDPSGFRWSRLLAGAGTGMAAIMAPLAMQRHTSFVSKEHGALATAAAAGADGAVQRVLERCMIRWARGLGSEVEFWKGLLTPPEISNAAKTSDQDAALARRWLETGDVHWCYDDLCGYLADSRGSSGTSGAARILNAGAGPLAPGDLECGGALPTPVISSDGLARSYLRIFDELGVQPPRTSTQCPVELLRRCFPRDHFDVVHMRNALDHAVDPLLGMRQMLEVVRPGGWVLLRHARNEGVPGQFRVGLHQWAFDVASGGPAPRFIVWSPSLRADATSWLLETGLAAEVRTELRPHPGGGTEDYVFVDIRKPGARIA